MGQKRNREATEDKLLEAATEVFARRGYDAATTKSIGEAAGVSEGLIHRYFQGKEGLLIALMRQFLEDDSRHPQLDGTPDNLQANIAKFFESAMNRHERYGDIMRVLVSRAVIDRKVGSKMGDDLREQHIPDLRHVLNQQLEGLVDKDSPDLDAAAFLLSALSFVFGFMSTQVFDFDREEIRIISEFTSKAIAKTLSKP